MTNQKLDLKSHEVLELLGNTPSWMSRWGSIFIVLAVASILVVGWFLKYPEVVPSPVILTSGLPPVPVVARTEGYLAEVFVKEEQDLEKGDPVAILSNAALYQDIKTLEEKLKTFDPYNTSTFSNFDNTESLVLGEAQYQFNEFIKALRNYNFSLDSHENLSILQFKSKITALNQKLASERITLANAENILSEAQAKITKGQDLLVKNQITQQVYISTYLDPKNAAKSAVINSRAEIEKIEIDIASLKEQLAFAEKGKKLDTSQSLERINENYKGLLSSLQSWKQKYLIISPSTGKISFFEKESDQQNYLQRGEEFAVILASGKGKIIGRTEIPLSRSGKIKEGQKVFIKTSGYPFQEFGKVEGIVQFIAKAPRDGKLSVEIGIPNGLVTTLGKKIPIEKQLAGTAEIITQENRLFNLVFDSFP